MLFTPTTMLKNLGIVIKSWLLDSASKHQIRNYSFILSGYSVVAFCCKRFSTSCMYWIKHCSKTKSWFDSDSMNQLVVMCFCCIFCTGQQYYLILLHGNCRSSKLIQSVPLLHTKPLILIEMSHHQTCFCQMQIKMYLSYWIF